MTGRQLLLTEPAEGNVKGGYYDDVGRIENSSLGVFLSKDCCLLLEWNQVRILLQSFHRLIWVKSTTNNVNRNTFFYWASPGVRKVNPFSCGSSFCRVIRRRFIIITQHMFIVILPHRWTHPTPLRDILAFLRIESERRNDDNGR